MFTAGYGTGVTAHTPHKHPTRNEGASRLGSNSKNCTICTNCGQCGLLSMFQNFTEVLTEVAHQQDAMKYDSLTKVIERHGGEWAKQLKMCSQCGSVVGFSSDGSGCMREGCDGLMRSLDSFVDTHVPDTVEVLGQAQRLEEAAETAMNDGRRREKQVMQSVAADLRESISE